MPALLGNFLPEQTTTASKTSLVREKSAGITEEEKGQTENMLCPLACSEDALCKTRAAPDVPEKAASVVARKRGFVLERIESEDPTKILLTDVDETFEPIESMIPHKIWDVSEIFKPDLVEGEKVDEHVERRKDPLFEAVVPRQGVAMAGKGWAGGVEWTCVECGFRNRPKNAVCGGLGSLGCKASRDSATESVMDGAGQPMCRMEQTRCSVQQNGGQSWQKGFQPVALHVQETHGGTSYAEGEKGWGWPCPECGFKNRACNTRCGGNGNLGCKAHKPVDWICSCGFVNRFSNMHCGGSGQMGCKAAQPLPCVSPPQVPEIQVALYETRSCEDSTRANQQSGVPAHGEEVSLRIHISNMNHDPVPTEKDVESFFLENECNVEEVRLVLDKSRGRIRARMAFVDFKDSDSVERAMQLYKDGSKFFGKWLVQISDSTKSGKESR